MKTVNLKIGGMTCAACSAGLERVLSKTEGVKKSAVSFPAESAVITYDDAVIGMETIEKAVKSLGFRIVDKTREERRADEEKRRKHGLYSLISMVIFTVPLFVLSMSHMLGFGAAIQKLSPLGFAFLQLALCLPVMLLGYRFYRVGFPAFFKGAANMDSLIAIGTSAAFLYSLYSLVMIAFGNVTMVHGLYFETPAMVITLVSLGKYLEFGARKRTGESVEKLLMLSPQRGIVERDGAEVEVPIEEIFVGDTVVVRTGAMLPVDGKVISGEGSVNEAMLTGESIPVMKNVESSVCGGSICTGGLFRYTAEKVGSETMISGIIRMVENARISKAPIARLADIISGYFAYIVSGIALVSGIIWLAVTGNVETAVNIFVAVEVISCPCALGLATPCSIMAGTGRAAEDGILFKDAASLEALAKVDTFVFDKTGTLTVGKPEVSDFRISDDCADSVSEVSSYALTAEQSSVHPLSEAIKEFSKAHGGKILDSERHETHGGEGVSCFAENGEILCGSAALMKRHGVDISAFEGKADEFSQSGMSLVFLAKGGKALALFGIRDSVRGDAEACIGVLRRNGAEVVMLTGDNEKTSRTVARSLGIKSENIISGIKPDGKAKVIAALKSKGKTVAMVGDGINDAVALAEAHVGIALGKGADVAAESADVILLRDGIYPVARAKELSRSVMKNIRENLFFAFIYNAIGIPIAAGVLYPFFHMTLPPMFGAFAMSLSSVTVVANSVRAGKQKSSEKISSKVIHSEGNKLS